MSRVKQTPRRVGSEKKAKRVKKPKTEAAAPAEGETVIQVTEEDADAVTEDGEAVAAPVKTRKKRSTLWKTWWTPALVWSEN